MILSFHLFAAVSSSCRGFLWCFHPLKISLHTVYCIKCLWGLHLAVLLTLYVENHPQKYTHGAQGTHPCQMQLLCGLDISSNGQNSQIPFFHLNGIPSSIKKNIYSLAWPSGLWCKSLQFRWILAFSVVIFKLLSDSLWACTLISVMAPVCWI